MRVRRDISSIPQRSASETWQRVVDLVTGKGSKDVQQLNAAILFAFGFIVRPIGGWLMGLTLLVNLLVVRLQGRPVS